MQKANPSRPRSANTAGNADAKRDQRFWIGLLYVAVIGYLAVTTTVMIYCAYTMGQPNRAEIAATMLAAMGLALGLFCWRHTVVACRWRVESLMAVDILGFVFLVIICVLDRGINSVFVVLLLLPMLYIGIGLPPRAVWLCGIAGMASYAALASLSPDSLFYPIVMLQAMALLIGWVMTLVGAITRAHQDHALRQLRQQLEIAVITDKLTGCRNQCSFIEIVSEEIERSTRYGHSMALLLIDVDYFKQVNDRYGHVMGDAVLRHMGKLLRQTARHADTPGRSGGDEFSLLAPETDREAACVLAERLRAALRSHPAPIEITLSIGVCAVVPNNEPASKLFRAADMALYTAKHRGRDQIAVCGDWDTLTKTTIDASLAS